MIDSSMKRRDADNSKNEYHEMKYKVKFCLKHL